MTDRAYRVIKRAQKRIDRDRDMLRRKRMGFADGKIEGVGDTQQGYSNYNYVTSPTNFPENFRNH